MQAFAILRASSKRVNHDPVRHRHPRCRQRHAHVFRQTQGIACSGGQAAGAACAGLRECRCSPQQVCVVYGHGGDAVPQAMQQYGAKFVIQEPQLGTGHAVQQAMPHLQDGSRTLVLYGDVPLIQHSTLHQMQQAGDGLVLLTVNLDNPTGYGRIVRNAQGDVQMHRRAEGCDARTTRDHGSEHRHPAGADRRCCAPGWASWATTTRKASTTSPISWRWPCSKAWRCIPCSPRTAGKSRASTTRCSSPRWNASGNRLVASRLMTQGVTLADPARIDVRGNLVCGRDVEIDVGCIFEGEVTSGRPCASGGIQRHPQCKHRARHADRALQPHRFQRSRRQLPHRPYARLRPGSKLHDDAHVGNFVEIKNSEIGQGSKANHLSYIGDSTVGSRVNIGAGTITCNYDGANKFRTIIEDDAFIGSDTQLVAPVSGGQGRDHRRRLDHHQRRTGWRTDAVAQQTDNHHRLETSGQRKEIICVESSVQSRNVTSYPSW